MDGELSSSAHCPSPPGDLAKEGGFMANILYELRQQQEPEDEVKCKWMFLCNQEFIIKLEPEERRN